MPGSIPYPENLVGLSQDQLPKVLAAALRSFGIAHHAYAFMPNVHRNPPALVRVQNMPDEWNSEFEERQFASVDPRIRHCMYHQQGTLFWDQIPPEAEPAGLASLAKDMKVDQGLTLPLSSRNGAKAGISLIAEADLGREEFYQAARANIGQIQNLVQVFHLSLNWGPYAAGRYSITRKQFDVINLIAQGHNRKSITHLLNLKSIDTVNGRLGTVLKNTGASNSDQMFAIIGAIGILDMASEDFPERWPVRARPTLRSH